MLFASVIFILFFLPLVLLFYRVSQSLSYRNLLLLWASIVFYFWGEAWHIAILFFTVIINYFFALYIDRAATEGSRKTRLLLGVASNISILIWFKYAGFLAHILNIGLIGTGLALRIPEVNHTIPLGISFFTFHAISYIIDTYRRVVRPESRFSIVSLYFFLFPHQIAGPIVRYDLFAGQVDARKTDLDDLAYGIERFILGLARKVLIANSVAIGADAVFGLKLTDISTPLAWLGIICYALQIYFDFSGYSDMAIGLARMFGFHFHENFNYPYRALSITDFWRRWHISLSTWFRDYLYIPLGGNRGSTLRTYFNLSLVFLLCGLWHGANWTFVVWGAWHGLLLVIERIGVGKVLAKTPILGAIWTPVMVLVGWVFFRAENLEYALEYVGRMFWFRGEVGDSTYYYHLITANNLMLVGAMAGLFLATGHWMLWLKTRIAKTEWMPWAYTATLFVFFIFSLSRLADGTFNPFIYFRF